MIRALLLLFLSLTFIMCGSEAPEPGKTVEIGSISGTVEVRKPKNALIYVAVGKSYDELSLGRPVGIIIMKESGTFRFRRVKPGTYYLGAFVDINGNRIPDIPMEPYFLSKEALRISSGENIKDVMVAEFFNERDPKFKTPQLIQEYKKLLINAEASVESAYRKLKTENNPLLFTVIPTLRAMVYEAATTWLSAGNEADWEHITTLLAPIAGLGAAAEKGDNPLTSQRGFLLRAYVSEVDNSIQRYAVYIPDEYDGSRPFPLIIALHGAGGDHWAGMKMVMGSSALIIGAKEANTHFFPSNPPPDFIVACPNGHGYPGPGYRKEGEYDVMKVIKELISNYNIDSSRIYLTGSSKGGRGTWEIGLKYPEIFAALAPVCGGTDIARTLVRNVPRMPIHAFHGARDRFVSVNESRAMSAAIYGLGVPVEYEYSEKEEMGHEAAILIYQDDVILDFFRKS